MIILYAPKVPYIFYQAIGEFKMFDLLGYVEPSFAQSSLELTRQEALRF